MKFDELLEIVGDEPLFTSSLLRAGDVDVTDLGSQLARWVSAGRLVQLRRGVYAPAGPYRTRDPHPFEVANLLVRPSYVSLESALSFRGLIPEAVFGTTSVTTARTSTFDTAFGRYVYRHITQRLMWGYARAQLAPGIHALVAHPEKALLDLVHLRPGADAPEFLRQLRLERLETLDAGLLRSYARDSGKPKLLRAAERLAEMIGQAGGDRGEGRGR